MPGPSGYLYGPGRPASEPSQDRNLGKTRKRAGNFPYDKPTMYGGARGIDNMGGGFVDVSQQHGRPLIPMDTEHTPWDDDTGELEQEASNYPGLFSKASDTGMGGTIPGTAGGWASPTKDWDAEDAVERAGSRKMKESAWARLAEDLTITIKDDPAPEEIGSELDLFDLIAPGGQEERGFLSLLDLMGDDEPMGPEPEGDLSDMYRRWESYLLDTEQG